MSTCIPYLREEISTAFDNAFTALRKLPAETQAPVRKWLAKASDLFDAKQDAAEEIDAALEACTTEATEEVGDAIGCIIALMNPAPRRTRAEILADRAALDAALRALPRAA